MESRIGVLDLHVRVPATGALELSSAARAFTCRVLERCDELLEQRAPGRLVFIRHLEMEWRVWGHALGAADEVEAVATEMARALDEGVPAQPRSADASDEIAVFDSEVHYRAEYLQAVSQRRAEGCWFFAPLLDEGPPPGLLVRREHRVLAEAVLARLAADGVLAEVLATLPTAAIADLAESLDVTDADVVERETGGVTSREAGRATSPVQRALAECIRSARRASRTDRPARTSRTGAPAPSDGKFPAPTETETMDDGEAFDTRFGGLFYLLLPGLELSLGEALWMACVSETVVFTRIAEALLGADASGDPAPRLFGFADADARLTSVSGEQHAEVAKGLLNAMVAALSRIRSPGLSSPTLSIAPAGDRRLLVATIAESPFALFAWPADSADTLGEGLSTFLALWPQSAPRPSAEPALSSLDRTGRIGATKSANPPPWMLPHEDLLTTALLTQSAGSVAYWFAARAGVADVTPGQLVERHLAAPARIVVTGEEMEIRMPMDRIDLALRRAGLDRDPGWVPWLQRHVRFQFVGDEKRT